jgi:hypothetical protein
VVVEHSGEAGPFFLLRRRDGQREVAELSHLNGDSRAQGVAMLLQVVALAPKLLVGRAQMHQKIAHAVLLPPNVEGRPECAVELFGGEGALQDDHGTISDDGLFVARIRAVRR